MADKADYKAGSYELLKIHAGHVLAHDDPLPSLACARFEWIRTGGDGSSARRCFPFTRDQVDAFMTAIDDPAVVGLHESDLAPREGESGYGFVFGRDTFVVGDTKLECLLVGATALDDLALGLCLKVLGSPLLEHSPGMGKANERGALAQYVARCVAHALVDETPAAVVSMRMGLFDRRPC